MGRTALTVLVEDFKRDNICLRRNAGKFTAGKRAVAAGDSRDMSHGCNLLALLCCGRGGSAYRQRKLRCNKKMKNSNFYEK